MKHLKTFENSKIKMGTKDMSEFVNTALYKAIDKNDEDGNKQIEFLKTKYSEHIDPVFFRSRPLRYAIKKQRLDLIEEFLNYDNAYLDTMMIINALESKNDELMSTIINHEKFNLKELESKNDFDIICIFIHALSANYPAIIRKILSETKMNPNYDDNTPLRNAAENGQVEILQMLLKHPSTIPSAVDNGAIKIASRNKHIECVKLLAKEPSVQNEANMSETELLAEYL